MGERDNDDENNRKCYVMLCNVCCFTMLLAEFWTHLYFIVVLGDY